MQTIRSIPAVAMLLLLALVGACQPQPQPAQGISGYEVILKESPLDASVMKQVNVACPAGKKALGAGWGVVDATSAILDGTATYFEPAYDGAAWLANARKNSTFTQIWKLQVRVICAKVGP